MPKWQVQSPEGTLYEIEGDQQPSEQELDSFFQKAAPEVSAPEAPQAPQFESPLGIAPGGPIYKSQLQPGGVPPTAPSIYEEPTPVEDALKPIIDKITTPLHKFEAPARDTWEKIVNLPSQIAADRLEMTPDNESHPVLEKVVQAAPSDKFTDVVTGASESIADSASFFTSPLGIATLAMGGLPAAAQRTVALAFAADMARQVPDLAKQLGEELALPEEKRDYQNIARITAAGVQATGFSALSAAHGLGARADMPMPRSREMNGPYDRGFNMPQPAPRGVPVSVGTTALPGLAERTVADMGGPQEPLGGPPGVPRGPRPIVPGEGEGQAEVPPPGPVQGPATPPAAWEDFVAETKRRGRPDMTVAEIQDLFPDQKPNREAARRLRDEAFGRPGGAGEVPPVAAPTLTPPPEPPVKPSKPSERTPEQVAADAAKPDPEYSPEDWAKYQEIQKRLQAPIDKANMAASFDAKAEAQKEWEALKNKYGGKSPAQLKPPVEHELASQSADDLIAATPEQFLAWQKGGGDQSKVAWGKAKEKLGQNLSIEDAQKLQKHLDDYNKGLASRLSEVEKLQVAAKAEPDPVKQKPLMDKWLAAMNKFQQDQIKGNTIQDILHFAPKPEPEATTAFDPSHVPTHEVPVDQIVVHKDIPNFKEEADPATGVVPTEQLKAGRYERVGTAPIVLWKKANGEMEVITGRHRLDLAKRLGEKTIPAQIVEEAKGFTKDMALTLDAESNIRDGQGSVRDYAHYFKLVKDLTEQEAQSRGLLSRAKGRAGWDMAKAASDDLYALWRDDKISEQRALAIARSAPGDAAKQQLGIKLAQEGRDPDYIRARLERERAKTESPVQTDMFGNPVFDDAKSDEEADRVVQIRKDLRDQIRAVQAAAKNPEAAAKLNVDVKDPAGTLKKIEALKAELEKWEGAWWLDKDLVAKVKGEAPKAAEVPKLRPGEKGTGELLQGPDQPFNLTGEKGTDAERIAAEKAKAEKDKAEAAALADKQQQALPGTEPAAAPPLIPEDQEILNRYLDGESLSSGEQERAKTLVQQRKAARPPEAPPAAPPAPPAPPAAPERTWMEKPLSYWKGLAAPQKLGGPSHWRASLARSLGVPDSPKAIADKISQRIAEIEAAPVKPPSPDNAPIATASLINEPPQGYMYSGIPMPDVGAIWDEVTKAAERVAPVIAREWRSFAMQCLPRITHSDRIAGEAGVRVAAAPMVARAKGLQFAAEVTEGLSQDPKFDQKLGTGITEDNLRGVKQAWTDRAEEARNRDEIIPSLREQIAELSEAADDGDMGARASIRDMRKEIKRLKALTDEDAATYEEIAKNVTTTIGADKSPFPTEAAYRQFMESPEAKEAIKRHKALWETQKDPLYRQANDLDPTLELETRGLDYGARINLKNVLRDDPTKTSVRPAVRSPLIRATATLKRSDPWHNQAKGDGVYDGSYQEIMANGFGREYPVAKQHEFIRKLIDSGDAVVKSGEFTPELELKGESTKGYPMKLRPWANQWLQIRRSLAPEYEDAMGLSAATKLGTYSKVADLLTRMSVQGFAEGSTHISNLMMQVFTGLGPTGDPMLNALLKAAGRSDMLVGLPKVMINAFADRKADMLKLAEIGAAKEPYKGAVGWFITKIDQGARLYAMDVYKKLAANGWVPNTETGLREYVNQVGQYNKRLQPRWIQHLRSTGVQPFATAMQTFNVQGLRNMVASPGIEAASKPAAMALRAEKAAGIMGFAVLVGTLNYMVSGNPEGPKGTKLGAIGWIGDDKKLHQLDLGALTGISRGPRITGLQQFVEQKRLGAGTGSALTAGAQGAFNTAASAATGPMNRFLFMAGTGKRPSLPPVQEAKIVPPQKDFKPLKTQIAANILEAAKQANPLVDAITRTAQGKYEEAVQRQFSRYYPRTGMSQETIENFPKIIQASELNAYTESLAKEARKQPRGSLRLTFINDRMKQDELDPELRRKAMSKLQRAGVFSH